MASTVIAVVAGVLVLAGLVALYARTQVIDDQAFADRATAAIQNPDVRDLAATEIVVLLIDRGSSDLIAARPLVETVVDGVLASGPFQDLFREAAVQANRLLFVRERKSVAFDLSDAVNVLKFGLQAVSPEIAKAVPKQLDTSLLELERREFATATLRVAHEISLFGLVLPALAIFALVAAVAVAPDRRLGVLRAAMAAATAGGVIAVALIVANLVVLGTVQGEDEISDELARDAVAGILDAFLGDLVVWALALLGVGVLVAAAAAALDPSEVEALGPRARRRLLAPPRSRGVRALRAIVVFALGVLVATNAALAVRLLAVAAGAVLVFWAAGELLVLLEGPARRDEAGRAVRLRSLARASGLAATLMALVAAALAIAGLTLDGEAEPVAAKGCNGSEALCDLRLDEAAFAGTHNSFSAADSPGWFIADQRRTIERQLRDGIRLLLLDIHWGVENEDGRVRTDFVKEGRERNKVAAALPPKVLEAARRLAGRLGLGPDEGKSDVWLCHTACELGATRLAEVLDLIRDFLEENPGEVLILFLEPYVEPAEIARRFGEAGLTPYLATIDPLGPMPTLRELIGSGRRLIVLTEEDAQAGPRWYQDGFRLVQDTALEAKTVAELDCKLNRGTEASPLLMVNHWPDVFPPRVSASRPFLTDEVITDRIRRCERDHGRAVNLIAADFYDQGPLLEVVDRLNRERATAPAGEAAPGTATAAEEAE